MKYRITRTDINYDECEIEAKNKEEAKMLAIETDNWDNWNEATEADYEYEVEEID